MLARGLLVSKVQKSSLENRIIDGRETDGLESTPSLESMLSELLNRAFEEIIESAETNWS
jgi:hypothetical protein